MSQLAILWRCYRFAQPLNCCQSGRGHKILARGHKWPQGPHLAIPALPFDGLHFGIYIFSACAAVMTSYDVKLWAELVEFMECYYTSKYQHHTWNYCWDIRWSNILGSNLPDPVLNYTERLYTEVLQSVVTGQLHLHLDYYLLPKIYTIASEVWTTYPVQFIGAKIYIWSYSGRLKPTPSSFHTKLLTLWGPPSHIFSRLKWVPNTRCGCLKSGNIERKYRLYTQKQYS